MELTGYTRIVRVADRPTVDAYDPQAQDEARAFFAQGTHTTMLRAQRRHNGELRLLQPAPMAVEMRVTMERPRYKCRPVARPPRGTRFSDGPAALYDRSGASLSVLSIIIF